MKEQWSGELRLIFQPAEEGCMGTKSVVDAGWLERVYFHPVNRKQNVNMCGSSWRPDVRHKQPAWRASDSTRQAGYR